MKAKLRPADRLATRPVETMIRLVRGQKIILDRDLAELYGVKVKALNQQVRRNAGRFPADFVFRLKAAEEQNLRSQFVTSSSAHGGRRYPPLAFTEHGALMAASVLNSPRAVGMSVFVVRAFVRLREILARNTDIAAKVAELERRYQTHDLAIADLVAALRRLTQSPAPARRLIGFRAAEPPRPKALRAAAR